MDKNTIKSKIKKIVQNAAPVFRFIPEGPRKRIADRVYLSFKRQYIKPKPYEEGKFPRGINLFGYFKSENGLAQGAKLYARALESSDIPHTLINLETADQNDRSFDAKLAEKPLYSVNVIHFNANFWQQSLAEFPHAFFDFHYNIGVWLWELEKVPPEWSAAIDDVDEIWVPSEFGAKPWRAMTDKPVTVIPYGLEVPYDPSLTRGDFGLSEDQFLVLVMFDSRSFSSRKNPEGAINAFIKAFRSEEFENAHLVIKISNPYEDDLEKIQNLIDKPGKYTLITEQMDKNRLNSLIRLCDVYISLHRAEGFGLVMAEAMALGTPVVATNWSANVEFMPKEAACMVDYKMIPVEHYWHDDMESLFWADPDVDQAAEYLQRLYRDKAFYESKVINGKKHLETYYSLENSAKKMEDRLAKIIPNRHSAK